MKIRIVFLLLLAIFAFPLKANEQLDTEAVAERRFNAFPFIIRLDGIGEIYGAAAGLQGLGKREVDVYVGASAGDVEASIFSLSDLQLRRSTLNYQFINLDELGIDTRYARGTKSAPVFRQALSGSVHHLGLARNLQREHVTAQLDMVFSDIAFEGFADDQGNNIAINMAGLHDVTSTILRFSLDFDSRDKRYFSEGVQIKNAVGFTTGRKGQSDQGQWDFQLSRHRFLSEKLLLSTYLKGSHSFVVSQASGYLSDADIRAELDAQCASLPSGQQAACTELENALVSYVLAANKYGTATAVGGGYGLRSYGEQFFRGANAWVQGVELEYQLPGFTGLKEAQRILYLVTFAESAQVNDKLGNLFDDSVYSVGVGLRGYVSDLALRLEAAHGEDGNTWNFRVGMPY